MISSTGKNRPEAFQRGFSLLELMVVIFIVGLISGAAILTLPSRSGDSLLQQQRYAIIAALRTARAEAVFSGRSLGLLWRGQRGEFYTLTGNGWAPITAGPLKSPLVLDDNVRSDISLSGQSIKAAVSADDNAQRTPQLLFLGDGQVSPFEWRLSALDAQPLFIDQRLQVAP